MIDSEYKVCCRLNNRTKYSIHYDLCLIMNLTCANYIYDLIKQSEDYTLSMEDKKKLMNMIYNLLGHKVDDTGSVTPPPIPPTETQKCNKK